jgi:phage gp46-like protein
MMSDIQTRWDTTFNRGDYAVAGGALAVGHDIQTAVLLSLFTDRLAQPGDVIPDAPPSGLVDRRGWWGDDDPHYPIGSRLWLLDRSKGPLDVAQRAEDYAREALQWLLDDGVAAKFDIQAAWVRPNQLKLVVVAYRTDGSILSNLSTNLW